MVVWGCDGATVRPRVRRREGAGVRPTVREHEGAIVSPNPQPQRCNAATVSGISNLLSHLRTSHRRTHPRTVAPSHRRTDVWAFTLIELMVVMSLIVILASISLALYTNSVIRAKESVLKEDLFRMRDAIDQYYADRGEYPASLDALVSDKYLRSIPVDPFTNSADTWRTIQSDPDPANATAGPGVYDVRSGSEQQALDGTNYADWN